ncbi:MAG: acyl--CoA ligase [Sphingomonadaceae bacterium]|nr:acyl--CoA ligase [Sphingomonadaceae bacterium]
MTFDPQTELEKPFGSYPDLIAYWGRDRPDRIALDDGTESLSWGAVSALVERIALQLQRDGLQKGQAVAILGTTSVRYALAYLAAVRAGGCAAPLTTSATPGQLNAMIRDSGAMHLFVDAAKLADLSGEELPPLKHVMLEDIYDWMAEEGALPEDKGCTAADPFNIIYSSGTTGTPKGIVHSRGMRWRHAAVGPNGGYGEPEQKSLIATPLYSNTTLALVMPTLAYGGSLYMMPKFDVGQYLQIAAHEQITHTMLVPVQYKRLMEYDRFDDFDLSSFQIKYCTSAPFSADLKAEVVRRWPGALIEIYSMTEGGVVCLLHAHKYPDKLHTVGQPAPGSEVFTIDEQGNRLPQGNIGELVGRSPTMMSGYQNQPAKTAEASWYDTDGSRWQRMGDIGRVDEDGFVELVGRAKDMIISGGFNIYPIDLEAVLLQHPAVDEAAVIGMPSERWGETPVGFVTLKETVDTDAVLSDTNARLGKTQRLSALYAIGEMPRSHIGKLLKTDLRDIAARMEQNA